MTNTCQKCGTLNLSQAAFCQNCASPLKEAAQPTAQQGWQQNPVGGPIVGGQPNLPVQQQSQRAMIAMIMAIAAILCCGPLLGIPAAIVGWLELDAIKNGRSPQSGKTMATVGLWLGIAATVIHGVLWVIWLLFGALISSPYAY